MPDYMRPNAYISTFSMKVQKKLDNSLYQFYTIVWVDCGRIPSPNSWYSILKLCCTNHS